MGRPSAKQQKELFLQSGFLTHEKQTTDGEIAAMGVKFSNFEERAAEAIYTENVRQLTQLLESVPLEECRRALCTTLPYDEHGRSLLHLAAWLDSHDQLVAMLQKEPYVDIQDYYGWTPLMVCLYRGNVRSAYALLQQSAHFDADTKEASWLLQYAVRRELPATALFLLERGVKADESRSSLLNIAADTGNVAMTRLLLEKNKSNPNVVDELGWAPLHLASGHDNLPIVRLLLEFQADVNLKDKNGNTPLAWARRYDSKLVITELEKLEAQCDEKWHGPEEEPEHHGTAVDYHSGEGSEVDENEMPSQEDSGASAQEYLDEYRNAMWVETNAEIQALALAEGDALYGEEDDGEYHVDDMYGPEEYHVQVHSGPYLTSPEINEGPKVSEEAATRGEPAIAGAAEDQSAIEAADDPKKMGAAPPVSRVVDKPSETLKKDQTGGLSSSNNRVNLDVWPAESTITGLQNAGNESGKAAMNKNVDKLSDSSQPAVPVRGAKDDQQGVTDGQATSTTDRKADESSEKLGESRIDGLALSRQAAPNAQSADPVK